jgi:hypothetical protein
MHSTKPDPLRTGLFWSSTVFPRILSRSPNVSTFFREQNKNFLLSIFCYSGRSQPMCNLKNANELAHAIQDIPNNWKMASENFFSARFIFYLTKGYFGSIFCVKIFREKFKRIRVWNKMASYPRTLISSGTGLLSGALRGWLRADFYLSILLLLLLLIIILVVVGIISGLILG